MTLADISTIRLVNQQVAASIYSSAKEIVGWMGAMQAQDYAMAKWAVGMRFTDSTNKLVETAIDKGEIIRTHLLRPTWHFVSADDVHWLLELTAPQIIAKMRSRDKELGLSASLVAKSNVIIHNALVGGNHLTKEELVAIIEKDKIATNDNRAYHLLLWAELEGIVCSGAAKGKSQTYALLNERVPKPNRLTKEEALAKLALRYFTSHGPATLKDFVWWSGLSITDARDALAMVKSNFVSETIGVETYWFVNSILISKGAEDCVYLLPAFDEFIISYRDRSASLSLNDHKKAVSSNGIFRPVILVNGQVVGLWRRTAKREKVVVEANFFQPQSESIRSAVEQEALSFGRFLGKEIEVKHSVE